MTMPHERLRALRWTYEVLLELSRGVTCSDEDRHRAIRVLENFPSPQALLAWLHEEVALPCSAAVAIAAAGVLLSELRRSDRLVEDCKLQLDFVLRHYPEDGEALIWVQDDCAGSLHEWLMPENVYADR